MYRMIASPNDLADMAGAKEWTCQMEPSEPAVRLYPLHRRFQWKFCRREPNAVLRYVVV